MSEGVVYRYLPLIRPLCPTVTMTRIPRAVVDLEAVHRQIAPVVLDVELVEDVGFEVDGVPVDVLGGVEVRTEGVMSVAVAVEVSVCHVVGVSAGHAVAVDDQDAGGGGVGGQVAVGGFADRSVALLQRHQRVVGVVGVGFDDGEVGWFQRDRRVVGIVGFVGFVGFVGVVGVSVSSSMTGPSALCCSATSGSSGSSGSMTVSWGGASVTGGSSAGRTTDGGWEATCRVASAQGPLQGPSW